MRHAIRFEGSYERNYTSLRPGADDYEGEDGDRHSIPPWPAEAAGMRFGFMEQFGKKFVAVRVGYEDEEIVLQHPVRLDPARHLGGKRFGPDPISLSDTPAGILLGDILDANPEQQAQLSALRDKVRVALRAARAD
jgi:hypothetical protein